MKSVGEATFDELHYPAKPLLNGDCQDQVDVVGHDNEGEQHCAGLSADLFDNLQESFGRRGRR